MTNKIKTLLKIPTAIVRVFIVIVNNIYCIPTYAIWMGLLMPLKKVQPKVFYKIEGIMFHWLLAVVSMWSYTAGYDIVEVGDNIEECLDRKTLVIANHQSTADVPLLMANFNAKDNILPNIMWIMDRLFKYTNFGIVSLIHEDFFISSGRNSRESSLIALKSHLKNSFIRNDRNWMVLFPEGGFLHKRRAASQSFAIKNNLPSLEYVTLPRVGAMKAIFEVMSTDRSSTSAERKRIEAKTGANATKTRQSKSKEVEATKTVPNNTTPISESKQRKSEDVVDASSQLLNGNSPPKVEDDECTKLTDAIPLIPNSIDADRAGISDALKCSLEYVLDITIAYPGGVPIDLPNIATGFRDPCQTHMLYRLYRAAEIPRSTEELTQWLYDRFVEKNTLLENFYKYGNFYTDDRTVNSNVIQQDTLRFLLINLFFITSTYFHYEVICTLYRYGSQLVTNVS